MVKKSVIIFQTKKLVYFVFEGSGPPSVGTYSGSGRWCTFGRTAGGAEWPEWINFQGFYVEPREGDEGFSGFITTNKKKKNL
jgi:hypothetical protein